MTSEHESGEIIRDLLSHAIPVNPSSHETHVTRVEFEARMDEIKTRIDNAALRQKIWVMGAALAIITTFGGGYVSLVSKLDRVVESLPVLEQKQESRGPWIQRVEQRDTMQDEALRKLDPSYHPIPYENAPQ